MLQNKCICFYLSLNNRVHIGLAQFEKIKCLPIKTNIPLQTEHQLDNFYNNKSPTGMNVALKAVAHPNTNTRASFLKLNQHLRNTNCRQKILSCIAPNIWNSLPVFLKAIEGPNTYKHKMTKTFSWLKTFSWHFLGSESELNSWPDSSVG